MPLIAQTKHGDCTNPACNCGGKNIPVIKVGKIYYCIKSHKALKNNEQIQKAKQRDAGRVQVKPGKKVSKNSISYLVQKLDDIVSRYIRIKYSDQYGLVNCYTCPDRKHFTLMQAGHFISRDEMATRWEEKNLKPQCNQCNCDKYGNLQVFKANLEKETPGITEWLLDQSRQPVKFSRNDLSEMLVIFKQKLKSVEQKLKS